MVTRRVAAALAASLLALSGASTSVSAAMTAWTTVVVRVYDTTDLSRSVREAAMNAASAALVTASVEVSWVDCSEQGRECQAPPEPRHLIVRLVNGRRAADGQRGTLGNALVDAGGHRGVLATVYIDRIRAVAAASGSDQAVLIGRAMAHELGHLLTGSREHARSGLMRGKWTVAEILRDRPEDWIFR